jgi:hypothetical protein
LAVTGGGNLKNCVFAFSCVAKLVACVLRVRVGFVAACCVCVASACVSLRMRANVFASITYNVLTCSTSSMSRRSNLRVRMRLRVCVACVCIVRLQASWPAWPAWPCCVACGSRGRVRQLRVLRIPWLRVASIRIAWPRWPTFRGLRVARCALCVMTASTACASCGVSPASFVCVLRVACACAWLRVLRRPGVSHQIVFSVARGLGDSTFIQPVAFSVASGIARVRVASANVASRQLTSTTYSARRQLTLRLAGRVTGWWAAEISSGDRCVATYASMRGLTSIHYAYCINKCWASAACTCVACVLRGFACVTYACAWRVASIRSCVGVFAWLTCTWPGVLRMRPSCAWPAWRGCIASSNPAYSVS